MFSKGAQEKINNICTNSPDAFNESLTKLALQGYRVLALAYRELDKNAIL